MKSTVTHQEGKVRTMKFTSETGLPHKTGLHTHTVSDRSFDREMALPYPVHIESATSHFRRCTDRKHDVEAEVIETVPEITPYNDGECGLTLVVGYRITESSYSGRSGYRSRPDLEFQHLVIFRKADNVSINVNG